MAGNAVKLEFAGDADKLQRAARQATAAVDSVSQSAKDAEGDYDKAGQAADKYGEKMGDLGSATTGAIDAIDSLSGGLQAVADVQDYARERAARLARANVDVMQATEDMAQANRDAKQSVIDSEQAELDLKQARLDQKTAIEDYNKAVKEHGKDSSEAKQAQLDLAQAGIDVKQAQEDSAQAVRDSAQANIDAKTAQVDLNDAMHEANPPQLQEWADKLALITPLLTAVIGVTSLVTAAQWAWNAAQLANPLVWIVLGIIALIAIIVLLVKNWDWVKEKGGQAWDWIKEKAGQAWDWLKTIPGKIGEAFSSVWGGIREPFRKAWDWVKDKTVSFWEWLKKLPGKIADAFGSIGSKISRPFRSAFNAISNAWNNTVGNLSWTVPGWVPGVGGNTVSAPRLPTFHAGGKVPGMPGQEVPIMALAGETVLPAGRSGGGDMVHVVVKLDTDTLIESIGRTVRRRGGNVQFVLGGANG